MGFNSGFKGLIKPDHEMIPAGGVSGPVRGTAVLLFVGASACNVTAQTENIMHFE